MRHHETMARLPGPTGLRDLSPFPAPHDPAAAWSAADIERDDRPPSLCTRVARARL